MRRAPIESALAVVDGWPEVGLGHAEALSMFESSRNKHEKQQTSTATR